MTRWPIINFQLLKMSKLLAKHIRTKYSFKITIRKRHVYIHIGWTRIWNQWFYLGIWNDECTKMIVLPSFKLATRLNSQNTNKTEFINELWHFNLFMNIGNSNWHNWSFDPRKYCFWLYFSSLHDYWPPSTWSSLIHTSWSEMERCEKPAFQLLKMRKGNELKHKNKVRNRFSIDRSSSKKNYTCHYVVSTKRTNVYINLI